MSFLYRHIEGPGFTHDFEKKGKTAAETKKIDLHFKLQQAR